MYAAATSSAAGWSLAATTRLPLRCSTEFTPTGYCWNTTTSVPAPLVRCGSVPDDKVMVMGLVTTKTPQIEPLEQIKLWPCGASSLVGAERLTISPQCDFATSGAGNAHP
jgi:hypothetical protein